MLIIAPIQKHISSHHSVVYDAFIAYDTKISGKKLSFQLNGKTYRIKFIIHQRQEMQTEHLFLLH